MTDTTSSSTTTTLLTLLHQYSTLQTSASTSLKSSLWQITKARRGRGYQSSGGVGVFGANEYSVENVREELCASALIEFQRQNKLKSCTTAAGLGLKNNTHSEPELIDEGGDDINNDDSIITGKLLLNNNVDDLSDTRMVLHFDGLEGFNKLATSSSAADEDADDTATTMTNDANNINFETTIISNNDPNHIQEGLRRRRRNNKGTGDDIINNDEVNTSSKWTTTEEQQQQSDDEGELSSNNDNEQEKHHAAIADPIQLFGVPPPALRMAQSYSRDALAYYVEVANLARQIMILVEKGGVNE
jgi:hypothetical protein